MFRPCPECGMMWHFSCHDQSCLDAVCSYCEVDMDFEWGDKDYQQVNCPNCGRPVMQVENELRESLGRRHVCEPTGAPLQVSEYAGLEPLGVHKKDDLKK